MKFDDLKHAQRERVVFLDQCFTWHGRANRRDLMERFGVSPAQAALDFKVYLSRAGKHAPRYDSARKIYVARPDHAPQAPELVYADWQSILQEGGGDRFGALPSLTRRSDPEVLARLSRVMGNSQAIEIGYTSMTTGEQPAQWIAPTHFASDGARVHVRAYSFKHCAYRDYVPLRIDPFSSFSTRPLDDPLPLDHDWETIARITLKPREELSEEQAAAVRREYAFEGETLVVEMRRALEFYADRRWGLDQPNARLERAKTEYFERPESRVLG